MTFENSKRLYEHYMKVGYEKAAKQILAKYPELGKRPEPEEKPKIQKNKKSK